jgi:methionyl-tRNA formyltransferase
VGVKLAFMGTASFALPSLSRLHEKGYEITGVITQPDRPAGRGQALQAPAVKKCAQDLHLPVYQPKSLKTDEARDLARYLAPDMIVVVAYGKILPPWLLQFSRYGCINLHGSLLPKYRGAAPVHWAIANGEEKTGVCTMLLDEGLDTGPVYLCRETQIGQDETAMELYGRLAATGAPMVLDTVQGVIDGTIEPKRQDDREATSAPVLKKEDGFIDWAMPAHQIHNRVRAFNPWPGTVTRFRDRTCKILKTTIAVSAPPAAGASAGTSGHAGAIRVTKNSLSVVCGDGALLEVISIQPENRKSVSGVDFANGARIQADEKFGTVMDN